MKRFPKNRVEEQEERKREMETYRELVRLKMSD